MKKYGTMAVLAALFVLSGAVYGTASAKKSCVSVSKAAIDLRVDMRKLWNDHNALTRMQIVSAVEGLPDLDKVTARLLKNQEEIGNAIKPYYGKAAGDKLTALLKDHIVIAGDVVKAAKSGDKEALKAADKKWFANSDEIVAFLSSANPKYWPKDTLKGMMDAHLDLITQIATDEIKKDFGAEMSAYDRSEVHALHMADALSDGIVKQFPKKFGGCS